MLATVIHAARDIRVEEVADPVLSTGGDAIVRVVAACVCGSDLWPYRGVTPTHEPHRIGHEFVGIVEEVGPDVRSIEAGRLRDRALLRLRRHLRELPQRRQHLVPQRRLVGRATTGSAASPTAVRASASACRSPTARSPSCAGPVVGRRDPRPAHPQRRDGHRPPRRRLGRRRPRRLGRGRRRRRGRPLRDHRREATRRDHDHRDVAASAAPGAGARVRRDAHRRGAGGCRHRRASGSSPDGIGADRVLECVGTKESMDQALRSTRPGGMVGYVGVPNGGPELPDPADVRPQRRRERRRRAGARLHRGAAARCALRCDPARPRLRPGAAAERGGRGVRRDGRAPRDEGAASA